MRTSHLIDAYERGEQQLLRETLISRPTLTLGVLYLPPEAGMTFQPTPEVDRLHILVRGRATLVHDVSQLRLEAGQAAGIAAPPSESLGLNGPRGATTGPRGATTGPRSSLSAVPRGLEEGHRIRTGDAGCLFISVALRRTEGEALLPPKPLSVFELRGGARAAGVEEFHTWALRTALAGKVRFLVPPSETASPYEAVPGISRTLLVLAGELELETTASLSFLPELSLEEVSPDEPHRLRSRGEALVLALTDSEAAAVRYASLSCGPKGRVCDLVQHTGDGLVLVDAEGRALEVSPQARRWLGLGPGELLQSRLGLDSRDWLAKQLEQPFPGPSTQTRLEGAGLEQGLQATFLPYRGGDRLVQGLLHLRWSGPAEGLSAESGSATEIALSEQPPRGHSLEPSPSLEATVTTAAATLETSDRTEHGPVPPAGPFPPAPEWVVLSPEMRRLNARLDKLKEALAPVLVVGPSGSGRSTVIDRLLSLRAEQQAQVYPAAHPLRLRRLDARALREEPLQALLLRRPNPQTERHALPGPAFDGLSPGSALVLEHLEALPVSACAELLKGLGTLLTRGEESTRPAVWLLVELEKLPVRYLTPTAPLIEGVQQRGAYSLVEVPGLSTRKEALVALLTRFMQVRQPAQPVPELTSEALELLLQASWPQELRGLDRLARALLDSNLHGPITAGVLKPLLEPQSRPSWLVGLPEIPTLLEAERALLLIALKQAGGNRAEVARLLGITRTRLYRMLTEHGLG